ncbi:hypothetical protein [Streptococcus iners]|uniref:Uncharacterized protein n=1 Tax=Streptococcus iners TaxID=3028084 RepID=A0AA96W142_9STRE|nr:hypothetical protein [Streptococcus sp. 29887]MCK4025762.1 hypothetical protein [Streptococcus suis]WNY51615.1 hypothetical protein PW252_02915 [Streptococcus sp. 29887]
MTESIFIAIGTCAVFAIPCVVVAAIDYRNAEKRRKEREAELLREQLTALACERAVEADRLARKSSAQQTLANWEPIKFADAPACSARKWGRHAG